MKIKLLRQPTIKEARHIFVNVMGCEDWVDFKEDFLTELSQCLNSLQKSTKPLKGNFTAVDAVTAIEEIYPSGGDEVLFNDFWKYLSYLNSVGVIEIVLPKKDGNV